MALYRVIGIEPVEYTNKEGRFIKGCNLFLGYSKPNMRGICAFKEYLSEGDLGNVEIDDCVSLYYNKFGKVIKVDVVPH